MNVRRKIKRWKKCFQLLYYKLRYQIELEQCTIPTVGPGKYVSVVRKGSIVELIRHRKPGKPGIIRMIPNQGMHGFHVEHYVDDKMQWRTHLSYDQLIQCGQQSQEMPLRSIVAEKDVVDQLKDAVEQSETKKNIKR